MWDTTLNQLQTHFGDTWTQAGSWFGEHLLNILIIVIGGEILYRVLNKAISKVVHKTAHRRDLFPTEVDRKKRVKTLDSLINTTLRIIIFLIAAIMIASELGVNTAPLVASAGVIGVALGIGAQSLIKDFMNGFFIITENQYRVGDVVTITTLTANAKVTGEVEAITMRTTTIRALDGSLHHVSNGTIVVTTNLTMNYASINEDITVAQDTDIDKLQHVIDHVGEEVASDPDLKQQILEPPHFDRIVRFTNEGILIKILGKTVAGNQWEVKGQFFRHLKIALDKNHIDLPVVPLSEKKRKS